MNEIINDWVVDMHDSSYANLLAALLNRVVVHHAEYLFLF